MMKKRMLISLLALCLILAMVPSQALAAQEAPADPYAAQRSSDGAIRPSQFIYYNGYYYFLYDDMSASITRHKPDNSDNTVLYSINGYKDLANNYCFNGDNSTHQLQSMLIYGDRIYVSVLLNNYSARTIREKTPAILSMNLDGTDVKEVLRTGDNTAFRKWCIYQDQFYISGWNSLYTANLDGSNLKASPSFSAYTKEEAGEGVGEPGYVYNGVCYFTRGAEVEEGEFVLYRYDVASGKFAPYLTTEKRLTVSFLDGGAVYCGDPNSKEKYRYQLDGGGNAESLGALDCLTSYQGNLYYLTGSTEKDFMLYKSAGLAKPVNPVALSKKGGCRSVHSIYAAGNLVYAGELSMPIVFDMDGSERAYDLYYLDYKNLSGTAPEKNGYTGTWVGYVVRPCFIPHIYQ